MPLRHRNPIIDPMRNWVLYSPARLAGTTAGIVTAAVLLGTITSPDRPAHQPDSASPSATVTSTRTAPAWSTYTTTPSPTPRTNISAPTSQAPTTAPLTPQVTETSTPELETRPTAEETAEPTPTLPPATAPGLDPPLPASGGRP